MTDLALFDDIEPAVAAPDEKLSAGRRLTQRQRANVAMGIHPLTRRRVHADTNRTCGTCVFRQLLHGGSRAYPKCTYPTVDLGTGRMPRATHSVASDVRAWWPGCTDHRSAETGR